MSSVTTRRAPVGPEELAVFHRALAELCRAEMPLPRAFRLLAGDLKKGRFKDAVAAMADEVEQGMPLADAYAARADAFPPLYRALVEAGLKSGDLAGVLEEIARHAADEAAAADRVRKALAYPLTAAAFVVVLGGVLLGGVGPTLWGMPHAMALRSPMVYALGAVGFLAVLATAAFLVAWRRGSGVPVLGRLRGHAWRASLAATVGLLLRREVPLPAAFELAGEPAAAERARRGTGLGEVLREEELFQPTLVWLVEAAAESGDAPRALADVAAIERRRLERAVDRVATLVTPLAEIVVGAAVFACAYSFTLPLYEYAIGLFRV